MSDEVQWLIRHDRAIVSITERLDALEDAQPAAADIRAAPRGATYPTVDAWVQQWFAPRYGRGSITHGTHWCPKWWDHPEAVEAFDALWRSWEEQHTDPNRAITWVMYLYQLLYQLTGPDGVFHGCSSTSHTRPRPLDCAPSTQRDDQ